MVLWGTIKHWTQNSRKSNLQACIHTQNIWKGRALMKQRMEKAKTIRFLYKAYSMRLGYKNVTYTETTTKSFGSFDEETQQKHKAGSAVSANGMWNLIKPIGTDVQENEPQPCTVPSWREKSFQNYQFLLGFSRNESIALSLNLVLAFHILSTKQCWQANTSFFFF